MRGAGWGSVSEVQADILTHTFIFSKTDGFKMSNYFKGVQTFAHTV